MRQKKLLIIVMAIVRVCVQLHVLVIVKVDAKEAAKVIALVGVRHHVEQDVSKTVLHLAVKDVKADATEHAHLIV